MKRPSSFFSSQKDSKDDEEDLLDLFSRLRDGKQHKDTSFQSQNDPFLEQGFHEASAARHFDVDSATQERQPSSANPSDALEHNPVLSSFEDQERDALLGGLGSDASELIHHQAGAESFVDKAEGELDDALTLSKSQVTTFTHNTASGQLLQNKYKIDITQQLPQFKTVFSSYCCATDVYDKKGEYHAIIFNSPLAPSPQHLDSIMALRSPYINMLHAHEMLHIEELNSKVLVAITDAYDIKDTLASVLLENGPLTQEQLLSFIAFCANLLSVTHTQKIVCGNINPRHILVQQEQYKLREFYQTYQGFEQNEYFLAPEIMNCVNYARHTTQHAVDIYAVGVTIFVATTGYNLEAIYRSEYDHNRLEYGTFEYFSELAAIPALIRPLLQGLLANNIDSRWKIKDLMRWIQNPDVTKVKRNRSVSANVYFSFNNKRFTNPAALAYELCHNWHLVDEIIPLISKLKFFLHKTQLYDTSKELQHLDALLHNEHAVASSEDLRLCFLVLFLNPMDCVNFINYSFTLTSIPQLITFMLYKKQYDSEFFHLLKALYNLSKDLPPQLQSLLNTKDGKKIHDMLANSFAFDHLNIAILAYSVNPNLPCLSATLINHHCLSIADLLSTLDSVIQNKLEVEHDHHIIAFLRARMELITAQPQLRIQSILDQNRNLSQWIAYLPVISNAQSVCQKPLHHLMKAILPLMNPIIENNIRRKSTKSKMFARLVSKAESGFLSDMISVIDNPHIFYKDATEYQQMLRAIQILHINKTYALNNKARESDVELMARRIGSIISSALCVMICIVLSI